MPPLYDGEPVRMSSLYAFSFNQE